MQNLLVQNARIVTPDEVLPKASLFVRNGRIASVFPEGTAPLELAAEVIDARGRYLLPGLIDLHTDAIEKEISPRPGANFPIDIAFRELERRMSGCGITTVYHSIYLGYYAAEKNDTISRKALFRAVGDLCRSDTIIDNRIHLRFEVTGIDEYMTCLELIDQGYVQLLSFMDHTPGQGQYGQDKYQKYLRSLGLPEQEIQRRCEESLRQARLSTEQMSTIAYLCRQYGIPIASHDDDNAPKVRDMHALGAGICEFPINEEAARQAIELGMPTVGGAANVLRGGSLSGNLHVQQAIEARLVDTLCSDYYPPALLHAPFKLVQDGSLKLPEAVRLSSLNAARAAGMEAEKGSIEAGKQADFLLVDFVDGIPVVTHTFLKGKPAAQASLSRVAIPS